MADMIVLAAEKRTEFGKGHARRARAAGNIPAVLYGHGTDPVHIVLPGHDTMMALQHQNALLTIEWDGTSEMAIAKDVQRDVVRQIIEHVDLLLVKKGEKITVDVQVHLEGESVSGTIPVVELNSIQIKAEATHLPESITVNIDGLDDGDKVLAGQIEMPEGSVLDMDPDQLVVAISIPRQAAEPEETSVLDELEGDEAAEEGGDESSEESAE